MDDQLTEKPSVQPRLVDRGQPNGSEFLQTARRNMVLDCLADADLAVLLDGTIETALDLGTVLYEPGRPVAQVHFPLSGVISLVTDLGDGAMVEAATVGFEGVSGLSVFLGADVPTERAVVQVAGRAVAVDVAAFQRAVAAIDGPFFAIMRRYTQTLFTQLARNAACNRVHTVQQRAARWLLTTADRMHSPTFELTQEFLAQMLAVRRASVSTVARTLADSGVIRYTRGSITILDRPRLRASACDCYQVVHDATERALASQADPA